MYAILHAHVRHVHPVKTQVSLGICPVWSVFTVCLILSGSCSWLVGKCSVINVKVLQYTCTVAQNYKISERKTKSTKWHMHPVKTQISLGISPIWSESLLSASRRFGSLKQPIKHTAKTLVRLSGCPGWSESALGTGHSVGFFMLWLKSYLQMMISSSVCCCPIHSNLKSIRFWENAFWAFAKPTTCNRKLSQPL